MASSEENGILKPNMGCSEIDRIRELSRNVNAATWSHVEAALGQIHVDTSKPFVICEYGCATGNGSFNIFNKVIDSLSKTCGRDQQVAIYYSDLLCNDFNALFRNIEDNNNNNKEIGISPKNVYRAAISKSFYEQCVPNNTVHLGYSALAMHWLSKTPCVIEDTTHSWESSPPEIQRKFAIQAEQDWENMLLLRAEELVEGGHVVIQLAGRTNEGEYSGCTQTIQTDFFQNFNQLYRQMCNEGIVQREEFLNVAKGFYARTIEEISKPFKDPKSEVFKKGLRLNSAVVQKFRCTFNKLWKESVNDIDLEESVKDYIKSFRVWNEHTWYNSLSDSRSNEEKQWIVEELYRRYENQVLQAPQQYGYDCVQCTVHFYKVSPQENGHI